MEGGYYPPGPGYPPASQPGYPPYPPGPPMQYPQDVGFQQPPPGYSYPPLVTQPVMPGYGQGMPDPITQQPYGGQQQPYGGQGPYHYGQGYYDQSGGQFGPPMVMQPQGGYVGISQTVPINVPPGLEYLAHIDRIFVKQKVELLEAFLGCETNNKYKIKNDRGELIFTAKEQTDCCTRQCCGPIRPFDMKIKDQQDREVIHLSRPLACDSCLCPCLLQSIEVFTPPGQLAGTVEQQWSICTPKFVVKNAAGEVVLRIEGPVCTFSLCGSVEFEILSKDGSQQVGKISKNWSGLIREAFTDADNFGISFPMDLDVRMKAVMLGACFLIDFMFFEKSQNQENDMPGML